MRAWGNRDDTIVIDEPFYAYYLRATGKAHPGADEVIATGETDWRKVLTRLTGPIANGKRIFFQKQMTHHLLPEIDREWLGAVTNCFLIRDPREVIKSYVKKREDPALEDLGFIQQAEIFDFVRKHTTAVRGARRRVYQVDAFLAARLARYRRRLGETLVRGGRKNDLLPAISSKTS